MGVGMEMESKDTKWDYEQSARGGGEMRERNPRERKTDRRSEGLRHDEREKGTRIQVMGEDDGKPEMGQQ